MIIIIFIASSSFYVYLYAYKLMIAIQVTYAHVGLTGPRKPPEDSLLSASYV